jgi:hypothetical protein
MNQVMRVIAKNFRQAKRFPKLEPLYPGETRQNGHAPRPYIFASGQPEYLGSIRTHEKLSQKVRRRTIDQIPVVHAGQVPEVKSDDLLSLFQVCFPETFTEYQESQQPSLVEVRVQQLLKLRQRKLGKLAGEPTDFRNHHTKKPVSFPIFSGTCFEILLKKSGLRQAPP